MLRIRVCCGAAIAGIWSQGIIMSSNHCLFLLSIQICHLPLKQVLAINSFLPLVFQLYLQREEQLRKLSPDSLISGSLS